MPSREWFIKKIELEGDYEIGAGFELTSVDQLRKFIDMKTVYNGTVESLKQIAQEKRDRKNAKRLASWTGAREVSST